MKKLLAILLASVLALGITSCGEKEVQVNLPKSYFGGETTAELEENIKANEDVIAYEINEEEGTVLVTMTEEAKNSIRNEMVQDWDSNIKKLYEGDEKVAAFVNIEYDDAFTKFDVYVDVEQLTDMDQFLTILFYAGGTLIQGFDGVAEADIDVEVNYIDNATKEVVNSSTYKEYIASLGQQ